MLMMLMMVVVMMNYPNALPPIPELTVLPKQGYFPDYLGDYENTYVCGRVAPFSHPPSPPLSSLFSSAYMSLSACPCCSPRATLGCCNVAVRLPFF
jgi:hypothetical protein